MKVLIVEDIPEEGKAYLRERGYEIVIGSSPVIEKVKEEIVDFDAALVRSAPFTRDIIEGAPKLKVIGRYGVGVDQIDVAAASEKGIYVVNAPLSNTNSVAEHTVALVAALGKRLVESDRATRRGDFAFRNRCLSMELEERVVGIVGLGRIGKLVAKKLYYGFGMKIIGYDPYTTKVEDYIEQVSINELFCKADFICLHLAASSETEKMLDKNVFKKMKKTAYIVNAARGSIIDEEDLIEALKNNEIAGAGLDVFEREPLPANHPFYELENIIITPHYAALSLEAARNMGIQAAQGIHEVLSGKKPTWSVNKPIL